MAPTVVHMQTTMTAQVMMHEPDRQTLAAKVVADVAGLKQPVLSATAQAIFKLLKTVETCRDSRTIKLPEAVRLTAEILSHVYYDYLQRDRSAEWPRGQKAEAWKSFEEAVQSLAKEGEEFFRTWKRGCTQQQTQAMCKNVENFATGFASAARVFQGPEPMWEFLETLLELEEPECAEDAPATPVSSIPSKPLNVDGPKSGRAQVSHEYQAVMFEGATITAMEGVEIGGRNVISEELTLSTASVGLVHGVRDNSSRPGESSGLPAIMFRGAQISTIRGGTIAGEDNIKRRII